MFKLLAERVLGTLFHFHSLSLCPRLGLLCPLHNDPFFKWCQRSKLAQLVSKLGKTGLVPTDDGDGHKVLQWQCQQ